jgi:hypothetical protein
MNDNFSDIEDALRRLTPRAPGEGCRARVAAALEAPARPAFDFRRVLAWSIPAFAAAACLAVVFAPGGAVLPESEPQSAGAPDAAAVSGAPAFAGNLAAAPRARITLELETPVSAGAPASARRVLSSIEPLELRRTPDGRFFQPYRVRYLETTRAKGGANAGATLVKSVPAEEVHFVGIDFI